MKRLMRTFALMAVAALGLSACTGEKLVPDNGNADGKFVTVHFGAEAAIEGATKATLTAEDEKTFKSAWENGDVLSVEYISPETAENKITTATWDGTSFEAKGLPNETGAWDYTACYPKPDETDNHIDFGANRTQNGNAYNGIYDVMIGNKSTKNSAAGKDDDGSNVVFNMDRQTGIAYFHLTGGSAEKVESATLSVEGGFIASQHAYISDFAFAPSEDLKKITITYKEGTAPMASDFQLWYNVLPTNYTKMTLTVETANHTLTISRNAAGNYAAGKLYKVVKNIPADKWVAKGGETPKPSVIEDVLTADKFKATGTTYELFTGVKATSPAVYAGSTAKNSNGAIQLRSSDSADGIVTTTSGGSATRISVVWGTGTSSGRTIDIYGKSTAYKAASDLYASSTNTEDSGTKIGSIVCGTSTEFVIEGDYPYIGIRSNKGALYLDSITITWGTPKTALETPANLAVSAAKVVSWDAVSGAASYEITIGTKVFTSETNSYDATAVVDDYYDVAVVAIPTDKENYRNSAAATLSGVKFGTPTFATPTLKEGVVDGASISVSWSVDERATAGYNCELFKGEVKVGESQIVKAGAVTFTGLDAETAYVVKVNAIAVEGAKAYAASPVATLDVTTKAASATANDGSLAHPYTAAEAIAAIDANTDLKGKHVKGVVTEVVSHNPSYGSMVYNIKSGEKTLKIFNGFDFGHTKFLGTDDLKIGDEVVVFGDLYKFNLTYELNTDNYLISINGKTEIYRGLVVSGQKTAFTVGDAFEFGGKALQVWRGKDDVDVTASATFSGYNMSAEGKQTVTVTVGEETVTYEINVRAAGGEAPKTYTLQFGKNYNGESTNGYSNNWSVTCEGFTWNMTNWNNNNNGWAYVKAGSKKAASVATITTKTTMPEAISTVTMTIDKITIASVNSIKMEVISATGATIETISGTVKQGPCVFNVTNPQKDCKYKIIVDCKKGSGNGFVQVSKVVYTNN